MKQIIDEICPPTPENANVSPYTQLMYHINPFALPIEDYMTAILHIGIIDEHVL